MVKRFFAVLLCSCLLAGSMCDAAFAKGANGGSNFVKEETESAIQEQEVNQEETLAGQDISDISDNEAAAEFTQEEMPSPKRQMAVAGDSEDFVVSVNTPAQVSLEGEKWFSFTAPEDGYYNVNSEVSDSSYTEVQLYLHKQKEEESYRKITVNTTENSSFITYKMRKGEVLYFLAIPVQAAPNLTLTITSFPVTKLSEGENGSYQGKIDDCTIDLSIKPGYRLFRIEAALSAGQTGNLDEQYYLKYSFYADNQPAVSERLSMNKALQYNAEAVCRGLTPGTIYGVYLELQDSAGNLLAILETESGEIEFTTGATSEEFVLTKAETTYCSIHLEYETSADNLLCYYASVSNPDEKKSFDVDPALLETDITGLEADTEYRIWFMERGSETIIKEETVKTAPLNIAGIYTVDEIVPTSAKISVQISEYQGTADYLYLYVEYADTDGKVQTSHTAVRLSQDDQGNKSGQASFRLTGLMADTNYVLNLYLSEESSTEGGIIRYLEESKQFQTAPGLYSKADIALDVRQDADAEATVHYTVTVAKNNIPDLAYDIYYRIKDSGEELVPACTNLTINKEKPAEGTITIAGLQAGAEYEFICRLPQYGVDKAASCTVGKAVAVPQFFEDVDAFDAVLNYELKSEKDLSENSWAVKVYYRKKSDTAYQALTDTYCTLDQRHKVTIYTGETILLQPDTDYQFKWQLYQDGSESPCHTAVRNIHTEQSGFVLKPESVSIRQADYVVTTAARTQYLKGEYSFDVYFAKDGGNEQWVKKIGLTEMPCDISFIGLEENASYAVSFRYNNLEYGRFVFSTPSRTFHNVVNSAGYASANLKASFVGNTSNENTYIYYFYREKDTEDWKLVQSYDTTEETDEISITVGMDGEALKQGTEYEYALVIADESNITSPDAITRKEHKATGTFKTKKYDYEINIEQNWGLSTYEAVALDVAAAGSNLDDNIYVAVSMENGQTQQVMLEKSKDYQGKVIFTDLNEDTAYILTEAKVSVKENGQDIVIATCPLNKEVITKVAILITGIHISPQKLTLNAGGDGEGIRYQSIQTEILPVDATAGTVWSSSNEAVATVDEWGRITAVGSGTAMITIQAKNDSSIAESCEVTVKNYVIARNSENTIEKLPSSLEIYKGDSVSGIGFYEESADGGLTLLEDYTVTFGRNSVAAISQNGSLTAKASGTTEVTFEKDGAKSVIALRVFTKAKGFAITDLEAADVNYPAIRQADGSYEVTYGSGIGYTAVGEISPAYPFVPSDFIWTSSNEEVVKADGSVLTPLKAGEAVVTVKPAAETSPYVQKQVEIKLIVKELPLQEQAVVYVLTNQKRGMLLGDVAFPESWGRGWSFKQPQTPLYTLPVNDQAYTFDIFYSGGDKYAYEGCIDVQIGTITGVSVQELEARHVIQVSAADAADPDQLKLHVEPVYMGRILQDYIVNIPEVNGLHIVKVSDEEFVITASEAGTYKLKPEVHAVIGKDAGGQDILQTVMTGTYEVKAVEDTWVDSIVVSTDTEGVKVNQEKGMIQLDFTQEMKGQNFNLTVSTYDRKGNELSTPVVWKVTDKAVATVKADKSNTHNAVITIKGEGHAVLTISAKDAAGYTAQLDLQFRDYRPRVSTEKAGINLAYDYESIEGRELAAASGGMIEIVNAYDTQVEQVKIFEQDQVTPAAVRIYNYESGHSYKRYILEPAGNELTTGTYKYQLAVKTAENDSWTYYPISVKVIDRAPKVTVKMSTGINLFYAVQTGSADIKISGANKGIESLEWKDASGATNQGFTFSEVSYDGRKKCYVTNISQKDVQVSSKKLQNEDIAKGTLTIRLKGISEPVAVGFKVKYHYKKPALNTINKTTSLMPKAGYNSNWFMIYDPQIKRILQYNELTGGDDAAHYNEVCCNNDAVNIAVSEDTVTYTYSGSKSKETIVLTLKAEGWREPLEVRHTFKVIEPKAYLSVSGINYNTEYKSVSTTKVMLKNMPDGVELADVVIQGTNAKAQALLDKDIFEMTLDEEEKSTIYITQNKAKVMGEELTAGTYTFNLIPYYKNAQTGEKTALNKLKLKLKVVSKPAAIKITQKGTLDLARSTISSVESNSICLMAKFMNIGSSYTIEGVKLVGEYSDYFQLERAAANSNWYLKIADAGELKAGQKYNLAVEYTIKMTGGDTVKILSNVFKVKPKQTAPKVTVANNGQTLYASADLNRTYTIRVPSGYKIESAEGGLDCNKDGKADITVSIKNKFTTSAELNVTLTDQDAVTASAKGKSYKIPVTVKVVGRDGLSKDAKITILVKVRR